MDVSIVTTFARIVADTHHAARNDTSSTSFGDFGFGTSAYILQFGKLNLGTLASELYIGDLGWGTSVSELKFGNFV